MDRDNKKPLDKEIISEEYMLGKEYYSKILEKAKEEEKENYK